MDEKKDNKAPDPKKIEKELGEFLNKKLGGNIKIITPSVLSQKKSISGKNSSGGKKKLVNFNIKPEELISYLDQYVVKQNRAKSILSTKICTHFNRIRHFETTGQGIPKINGNIKSNILMLGPTGIGKTYLVKLIAKKIGVPFVKADATKFSETGYVGGDVEDLIRDLVKEADDDIELAECGIIYIDEIDKIAASQNAIGAQVSRTGVQRSLLKPMEETDVDLKVPHDPVSMMQELESFQKSGKRTRKRVNTSNILFIVSGAFSELSGIIRKRLSKHNIGFESKLPKSQKDIDLLKQTKAEDLVQFGFESEFIGRIPVRCILDPLSEEDLYSILKMPNNPVILSKRLDFAAYGIKIAFTDKALKIIAKKAYEENTGARGLVSVIEESLLDFEEKLPSNDILKITVTEEVLTNPKALLENLLSKKNKNKWNALYEKTFLAYRDYISEYIKDRWGILSGGNGLKFSEKRCLMASEYFCRNITEVEDAVKKIKRFHDSLKEMRADFSKSSGFEIVFEEDAIDFLIEEFVKNVTYEEILSEIYKNFYDCFNLINEKKGENCFYISKKALTDHEKYLDDLIRKEIR